MSLCPLGAHATWVVPPGHEAAIVHLAAPWQLDQAVSPDVRWTGVAIGRDSVAFTLTETTPAAAQVTVTLGWQPDQQPLPPPTVRIQPAAPSPLLAAAAHDLQTRLVSIPPAVLARDVLTWLAPPPPPPKPGDVRVFRPYPWSEVSSALAPLPVWLVFAAVGCGALAWWLGRRRLPLLARVVAAVTFAGLPLWAWQSLAPLLDPDPFAHLHVFLRREVAALTVLLAVVGLGVVSLIHHGWRELRRPDAAVFQVRLAWTALLVAVVSAVVRYGLADLNLMTDADSGYERLLTYLGGYGGDHLLLTHLLPDTASGDLLAYMAGIRALATLGPPLWVLVAGQLGLPLLGATLAGLALAVWPIHAALSASDVLQGPVLTLMAVALLQWRARDRGLPIFGALTLGYAIWCRPELALTLAPCALVAAPAWRDNRRRALVLGGIALAAIVGLRGVSLHAIHLTSGQSDRGFALQVAPSSLVPDPALLPWFLAAGLLLAIAQVRRWPPLAWVALVGSLVGLLLGAARAHTLTELEFIRYSAPAAPWLAVLAALGWTLTLAKLPQPRVVALALLLAMLAHPWLLRGYLRRTYDSTAEAPLFLAAAAQVPTGATLVVPGEARDDGLNPCQRYRLLLAQAQKAGTLPAVESVCANDLLAGQRALPAGRPTYWFHGTDCHVSSAIASQTDLGSCAALESRFARASLWTHALDLWHRRAVTTSADPGPPGHQPEVRLHLDRLIVP